MNFGIICRNELEIAGNRRPKNLVAKCSRGDLDHLEVGISIIIPPTRRKDDED